MSSTQFIPDPDGDNLADIASVSSNSQGSVRVVPDSVEPASGVCSPAVNHVAFEAIFPPNSVSSKPESANSRAHSVRVSYPKPIACLSFLDGPAGDIFAAFCSAAAIVTDVMLYPTTAFQMTRTVHAIPLFPYYQTVYVLSYIGFVYWYWRHLETQVLLRKLLLTFESFYLCLFAVTWMFATTLHIEPEFETRGMPVNMDYTRYITARVNALLVFSMSFVSVLCCDALVRVSVAIKVWFHFLFVVFAVNIWSSVNGVDSHAESPTTICLGSTPLSCFSTHSMRVAPLIFISLYLVRNIFVMTSHYFRPWLSPMSSHVLMTVKSGVSFTLLDPVDEMNPSNTSMEQRQHSRIDQMSQSIDPGTSGYELKLAKLSASARVSVTPQLASGLPHAIEMIDANRSHEHNSDSEVSMVPGSAAAALPAEPASVPSQIQVVSASSSNSHDNMLVDDAKTQSLTLQFVSAFNNDFDTDAAPRKSCLGNMMFEAWQNLYLQVAFFILCLAIGVLCYFGEPRSPMMALILWLLVASCCILIASLLELRIMLKLFQTFEFWLLNGLNLFSLAACLYFTVATNAAAAEFNERSRSVQMQTDLIWYSVNFLGNSFVLLLDALLIQRRTKLVLCSFWLIELLRDAVLAIFWPDGRLPIDSLPTEWCMFSMCTTPKVIMIQASLTFAVFCLKYIVALLRFPNSMLILRSSIFLSVPSEPVAM